MEQHRFFQHFCHEPDFLKKLRTISLPRFKTVADPEKLKLVRGLAFVFISILLGFMSMNLSEERGLQTFRQNHWLPEIVWNAQLTQSNFQLQHSLGDWSSVLKTHPSAYSKESKIWVTKDGTAIYIPKSPYPSHPGAELWTRTNLTQAARSNKPVEWILLGSGISGFEKMSDFLAKTPQIQNIRPSKPYARRNIVDPKEIRY